MTLRPRIPRKQEKGQPEGSAVTGKTRKPRAAEYDPVSQDAADHKALTAQKPDDRFKTERLKDLEGETKARRKVSGKETSAAF
jgi:hypothetical protein